MAAVVNYSPPWWVNLLHRLPHFNMEFQIVSSDFRPEDSEYQKVRQAPVGGRIASHSECVISCIVRHHLITPPAACPHCCFQRSGQMVAKAVPKPQSCHVSPCTDGL